MNERISPLLNLLTSDNQYAYKNKKSTIDILSIINNQTKIDATTQIILFDFSKAFDNIERDILWTVLYEVGLPINFIKMLKMGHEGNKLKPKCDGYIGQGGRNNNGGLPRKSTKHNALHNLRRTHD